MLSIDLTRARRIAAASIQNSSLLERCVAADTCEAPGPDGTPNTYVHTASRSNYTDQQ